MAYQMAATAMTLKVIHWLHAFSNAIHRTFVQHFTRFQLISTDGVLARFLCIIRASCVFYC